MLRTIIDASVLAVPKASVESVDASDFEEYVERLLELSRSQSSGFGRMLLPRGVEEILFETKLYPLWDGLAEALTAANLHDIYQPQDVVSVVDGFFKHAPRLEDELGVDELLANPPILDPDDYLQGLNVGLANGHRSVMLLASLLYSSLGRSECGEFVIVGRPVGRLDVRVRGRVEDWMLASGAPCEQIDLPLDLDECVTLVNSWDQVLSALDPTQVWRAADTSEEYAVALRIFVKTFANQNGIDTSAVSLSNWRLGSSFLETVDALGFGHDRPKIERLLTALAETILKVNLSQVHQLRTGKGGNSPQIRRGNDGAWRRDIDHEFHLHFWSTMSGPEFASVVVHNDFEIPE